MPFNVSKSPSHSLLPILRTGSVWIFRVAVIACLVFFFQQNIDLAVLFKYFDTALPIHMLMIQPIILAGVFLFALRFSCLLPAPKPPLFQIFKSLTLSMGLNNILPGRIPELVKATYLKEHANTPIRTSLAAVLLERMIDVFILCMLTAACIANRLFNVSLFWANIFIVLLVLMTCLFIFEKSISQVISRYTPQKLRPAVEHAVGYVAASFRQRYFYAAMICGIGGWCLSFFAVSVFLAMAVETPLGNAQAFSVFVATVIGIAIPAVPGGFGTYEAGAVIVLKDIGFGLEQALAIAIAMHMSQILFCVMGTVVILAFERIGIVGFTRQLYSYARTAGRCEKQD
jgi:uncharacterized protein (TIRG00374 family)